MLSSERKAFVCEELYQEVAGSFCQTTWKHLFQSKSPHWLICREQESPLAVKADLVSWP